MLDIRKGCGGEELRAQKATGWEEGPMGRVYQQGRTTKHPSHPLLCFPTPGHNSTICSHYHGRDLLVSSQLPFLKTSGIIKQIMPCWVISQSYYRHGWQLLVVVFRILFNSCCLWGLRTNIMTLHTFDPHLPNKRRHTPLPCNSWVQRGMMTKESHKSTWIRQASPFYFSLPFCSAGFSALTHYTYPVGCSY